MSFSSWAKLILKYFIPFATIADDFLVIFFSDYLLVYRNPTYLCADFVPWYFSEFFY